MYGILSRHFGSPRRSIPVPALAGSDPNIVRAMCAPPAAGRGMTGPNFDLTVREDYISRADGDRVPAWGCTSGNGPGAVPGTNPDRKPGRCGHHHSAQRPAYAQWRPAVTGVDHVSGPALLPDKYPVGMEKTGTRKNITTAYKNKRRPRLLQLPLHCNHGTELDQQR
jgi:hypothetical protein